VTAFFADDYRIDQDQLGSGLFLESHIYDGDSFRDADLRSRQPNAASRIHRLEHVFHQLFESVIEAGHHSRRFFQDGIANFSQLSESFWDY